MNRKLRTGLVATAALCTSVGTVVAVAGPAGASSKKSSKSDSGSVETPPSASLTETGSTLLYPLWNLWVPAYTSKYSQVNITTAGTGSGTGINDAANGTVNIGSSDAYLSPADNKAHPDLENIPLAISAQFVGYNVPGVTGHIKLSGKVLSEIYQGKITNWNDPAIAAMNSGLKLPNLPIVVLHRTDGSGDTFLFTTFLSKNDPNGWGAKVGYNTSVSWPSTPGGLGEEGNSGMVSGCKATPGCVAYIGISYLTQSLQDNIGEAELKNQAGNFLLPNAKTISAEAAGYIKKTPDSGTISLIYGPAKDGYPIINYEYAIVSTHQSTSNDAKAVRSVLEWAINHNDGNSSQYLNPVFFQPLPQSIVTKSDKLIAKIK